MKKIFILTLLASATACLAGCAGNKGVDLPDLEGQKFSVAYAHCEYSEAIEEYLTDVEFVKNDDGSTFFTLDFELGHASALTSNKFVYSTVTKYGPKMEKTGTYAVNPEVQTNFGSYGVKDEKHTSKYYVKSLELSVAGDKIYHLSTTLYYDSDEFYIQAVLYKALDKVYDIPLETLVSKQCSVVTTRGQRRLRPTEDVSNVKFTLKDEATQTYELDYSTCAHPENYERAICHDFTKERYNSDWRRENMFVLSTGTDSDAFINMSDKGFGYMWTSNIGLVQLSYFTFKA